MLLMSDAIKAKAICTLTNSGYTAFQISAWRPSAHISIYIKQKNPYATKFVMGVKSYYYDKIVSTDDTVTDVNEIAREKDM
jgi:pyruvate kinase